MIKTTDLCDENEGNVKVAAPSGFISYGGRKSFYGSIHTVKCFENNPLVKAALEGNGEGKVLIVDGGGSKNCALLGDMLGGIAVNNKWNGIIINGCIRDSAELADLDLGVLALNTNPKKSGKKNEGQENTVVSFSEIDFIPGGFVYCDADGIITSGKKLI